MYFVLLFSLLLLLIITEDAVESKVWIEVYTRLRNILEFLRNYVLKINSRKIYNSTFLFILEFMSL